MLEWKARHGKPGEVRPHLTGGRGDSFDRDTGRWLDQEWEADRGNNRYRERLVNKETGEILRMRMSRSTSTGPTPGGSRSNC
jgi:hypothetical protein